MSDADGKIIPFVEDDQGEGIKDFLDKNDFEVKIKDAEEFLRVRFGEIGPASIKEELEKGKTENEMLREILDRIERMENFLRHTFDGHVLINGQFRKIL